MFWGHIPFNVIHLKYCCSHTGSRGLRWDTRTEQNSCITAKQGNKHYAVIVPLKQYMAAYFLLCPILRFTDRTSHAAVSSAHTVEVQSSPGEVTHSPSWGLQNSTGLSACFSCYASSCSSLRLSSLMPLRVLPPSLTANILKASSIATLYLARAASKAALQRLPFAARVTGVSLPSVQDLYQSPCLQRTGDINKALSHPLHKLFSCCRAKRD